MDIAVSAARKAFEGPWAKTTPEQRGRLLVKLADLFEQNLERLAAIEALDNGKAFNVAKGDIGACAGCLRYYGGWADKIEGKVIETNPDTFNYTRQEPVNDPTPASSPLFVFYSGMCVCVCVSMLIELENPRNRLASALKSSHGISPF